MLNDLKTYVKGNISVGIGYIIVPPDVDRQKYIDTCYAKETVSMYLDFGGFSVNNVRVSVDALNLIEFPKEGEDFGSCVIFCLHPQKKFPIVLSVINKDEECLSLHYKEFKRTKSEGLNSVTITGNGQRGSLHVSVEDMEGRGGEIYVSLNQRDRSGKFTVEVKGQISLISDNLYLFNKKLQLINETTSLLSKTKISLGVDNYEQAVLGNTLNDEILGPLINVLKQFRVQTAMGPSGIPLPDIVQSLQQIQGKLGNILSEKVELE